MTSGQDRTRRGAAPASRARRRRGRAGCPDPGRLRHRRAGAPVAPSPMSVKQRGVHLRYAGARYTCHGAKINPPLNWSGAPPGTKSFALIVDDSSAPITPFIYWLVFDINSGATDIQEGSLPTGARQGLNSAGTATYTTRCPAGLGTRTGLRFMRWARRSTCPTARRCSPYGARSRRPQSGAGE